jgi:hypothetical protein
MFWPMLVSLLTYAVFGQSKYADRLPDPGVLAEKTRALMKPVTTERNRPTMFDRIKERWANINPEDKATIAVVGLGLTSAVVSAFTASIVASTTAAKVAQGEIAKAQLKAMANN